jgi:hypothetical protein
MVRRGSAPPHSRRCRPAEWLQLFDHQRQVLARNQPAVTPSRANAAAPRSHNRRSNQPIHLHRHGLEFAKVGDNAAVGVMKDTTIKVTRFSPLKIDFRRRLQACTAALSSRRPSAVGKSGTPDRNPASFIRTSIGYPLAARRRVVSLPRRNPKSGVHASGGGGSIGGDKGCQRIAIGRLSG